METAQDAGELSEGDEDPNYIWKPRGQTGVVDSTVFQKTVDYSDEYANGFHVVLDDETWVTVRRDQVSVWH